MIKVNGKKYDVYSENGSKIRAVGFESIEQANWLDSFLRSYDNNLKIEGVEIFSTGEHNGDKYSSKDLEDMVEAYHSLDFDPAVKLGHVDDSSAPAYGYLSNIRKEGDKIITDLIHLPKDVYNLIKDKRFGRVSAEVFWNFKRNGKVYRRVIGALALLGQAIPGVSNLKPLYKEFANSFEENSDEMHCYKFNFNEENKMDPKEIKKLQDDLAAAQSQIASLEGKKDYSADLAAAQAKIAKLEEKGVQFSISDKVDAVKVPSLKPFFRVIYNHTLREDTKVKFYNVSENKTEEKSFTEVIDDMVSQINKQAGKLFNEQTTNVDTNEYDNPGEEVDKRVKEYVGKNPGKTYEDGMSYVLQNDTALASAYSKS